MTNTDKLFSEFMGILLTKETDNCLRLQSLLQGVSRGELTRNIIDKYVAENGLTTSVLIDRYSEYIYTEWRLRYKERYEFQEFVDKHYISVMEKQGQPRLLINGIVKRCKELEQTKD